VIAAILAVFCQAADVERAVEDLRSDDIAVRERAERELEKQGPSILPDLEERIGREDDAEVRLRLIRCRREIERAMAPGKLAVAWEQGDLAAALRELARIEGSDAPESYVEERTRTVRQALENLWAAREDVSRTIFPRPLDEWARPIGINLRWLVPILIEWATERDHPFRDRALVDLAETGPLVFPIVRALLKRNDPFCRQTACIVLGDLKDDRAAAELERLGRDPRQDPELRKLSRKALMKQRLRQMSSWDR
jgi:hypothetical protein